jgi:hypothetical protein
MESQYFPCSIMCARVLKEPGNSIYVFLIIFDPLKRTRQLYIFLLSCNSVAGVNMESQYFPVNSVCVWKPELRQSHILYNIWSGLLKLKRTRQLNIYIIVELCVGYGQSIFSIFNSVRFWKNEAILYVFIIIFYLCLW